MDSNLKTAIKNYLEARVTAVGFAPIDHFEDAPKRHHPVNY